jgi:hypothetical protein
MPDYDYDEFTRRPQEGEEGGEDQYAPSAAMDAASDSADTVELDSDESSDLEMDTEELSTSWED